MTAIDHIAGFISKFTFERLSAETVENVKIHLIDTLGAMLSGPQTLEGMAIGKLIPKLSSPDGIPVIGYPIRVPLLQAVMAECSATRCTEMDDIHLQSCTTPGSVIVPTALSLGYLGYLNLPSDFLVAITLGYEMLIRVGMAIDGPRILYQGIWPTYMGAVLGSATVSAKALKLDSQKTSHAIATALTMSTAVAGRIRSVLSSRWLTLGVAAQNGVISAFSSQEGFAGDNTLLDRNIGPFHGLMIYKEKLLDGLGQHFFIDQTSIKPYPVARQALSAVEAFQKMMATHKINPESIKKISVWVPGPFLSIIDHPEFPETRQASVVSVQYQIALAAFEPDRLYDVRREPLMKDDRVINLMAKIEVKPSEELECHYPSAWPARVEVKTEKQSYSSEMLYPKGDAQNKFNWDEVISKFRWVAKPVLGEIRVEQVIKSVQKIDSGDSLKPLLELLTELEYNFKKKCEGDCDDTAI